MSKCTCQSDLEKRLTERFVNRLPDSKDVQAHLAGYAFVLGESLQSMPYMPVHTTHAVTIKKTGLSKQKTEKTNMFFTFCPFCGVSLKV